MELVLNRPKTDQRPPELGMGYCLVTTGAKCNPPPAPLDQDPSDQYTGTLESHPTLHIPEPLAAPILNLGSTARHIAN